MTLVYLRCTISPDTDYASKYEKFLVIRWDTFGWNETKFCDLMDKLNFRVTYNMIPCTNQHSKFEFSNEIWSNPLLHRQPALHLILGMMKIL